MGVLKSAMISVQEQLLLLATRTTMMENGNRSPCQEFSNKVSSWRGNIINGVIMLSNIANYLIMGKMMYKIAGFKKL